RSARQARPHPAIGLDGPGTPPPWPAAVPCEPCRTHPTYPAHAGPPRAGHRLGRSTVWSSHTAEIYALMPRNIYYEPAIDEGRHSSVVLDFAAAAPYVPIRVRPAPGRPLS